MDLVSLLAFAGILVVAAGTPGPNVGALVARVISRGHKGVFPFMFGLWLGDAIWLSLAVWGLAALANTFHTAFLILKYMGVAYLIYLSWKMWIAPVDEVSDENTIPRQGEAGKLFLSALAITLEIRRSWSSISPSCRRWLISPMFRWLVGLNCCWSCLRFSLQSIRRGWCLRRRHDGFCAARA